MVKGLDGPSRKGSMDWSKRGAEIEDQSEVPSQVWAKLIEYLRPAVGEPHVRFEAVRKQSLAPNVDDYIVEFEIEGRGLKGIVSVTVRDGVAGDAVLRENLSD